MHEHLGSLCVLVVIILIVVCLYDKYLKKEGMVQSAWPDAGVYGTENGAYPYWNYSGYSGQNMYRPGSRTNSYASS